MTNRFSDVDALLARNVGPETSKTYKQKLMSGFFEKYCSGQKILEIGYDGGVGSETLFADVTGLDTFTPGYDGIHLPYEDSSFDTVYASHIFEHVSDYTTALQEWYRVLVTNGFLIIIVPHQWMYEKKATLPSRFNADHKRFYTSASLLREIQESLPAYGYRVRHCIENDGPDQRYPENTGWDPSIEPGTHSVGCYEIELVLEKIAIPKWAMTNK